ncbi:ABC-2 family transporter protein [Bacteriovorax sp. DB6_IX]|uniref:ABC transporter permease n=1 Tax=Bacteriovorax sp. DB6_IX TaxID=1353530 RepID=UPI00038A1064|nr:ABC-2 family transporter protein [Bacteriovorax sp. DB6_IX]EQC50697.1 ABC-2 family transporter protein [Bacteriovorax sp. DB6_IX]
MNNILKWFQTIRISWSRYTAYRLNFFLQIIGPSLVFFFIKYNLWTSIYSAEEGLIIKGYSFHEMITYHIWSFVVAQIAQGHTALNLSIDIRMGRISSYLIYPFNFWEFHTASFIGFQILQLAITSLSIGVFVLLGIMPDFSTASLLNGITACLYVSMFWYALQYFTGMLAFWLEETWIMRVILQIVTVFLSGAIIPLELFPEFFREFLTYTPFPYLTYYPIKIFMGSPVNMVNFYGTITIWIGIFAAINSYLWKRGIRLYTAAGM